VSTSEEIEKQQEFIILERVHMVAAALARHISKNGKYV